MFYFGSSRLFQHDRSAGSFSPFTVMVYCPFSVSVLWILFVVSSGGRCWLDDVDQSCELVFGISMSDCNFCKCTWRPTTDTQVAVAVSFRFSFCMVFRTPRNVKPVKLKLSSFSVLVCFGTCCLLSFSFL